MAFLISKLNKIKEEDLIDDKEFFRHLLISIETNLDYYITVNQFESINKGKKRHKKCAYFNGEKLIEVTFKSYGAIVNIYFNNQLLFQLIYLGYDFFNIYSIKYYYKEKILIEEEYSLIPDQNQELRKRQFYYNGKMYKEIRFNYKEKAKAMIFYENISGINVEDIQFLYFIEHAEDTSKMVLQLVKDGIHYKKESLIQSLDFKSDILSIYSNSVKSCKDQLFDEFGNFKYANKRIIEVAYEVYQELVDNTPELKDVIQQGTFSYQQLKNLVRMNTISDIEMVNESMIYQDSISTNVSYALYIWQNEDKNTNKELAIQYKTIREKFSVNPFIKKRDVKIKKMRNSIVNFFKKLTGKQGASFVSKRLKHVGFYRIVSRSHLSTLLRANLLINLVTAFLISTSDIYCLFSKLISPKQAFKNIFKKMITLIGAASGATVAVIFTPTIGIPLEKEAKAIIGGVIGGYLVGLIFKVILDKFIIDDKQTMMSILEDSLYQVSISYLLNEKETKAMIDEFMKIEMIPTLQQMYKSTNRVIFAYNLCVMLAINKVMDREKVALPNVLLAS